MARKKKTEETPENVLYKVTSKGDTAVFFGNRMIRFDKNLQAVVDKETFEALKEMGVLL